MKFFFIIIFALLPIEAGALEGVVSVVDGDTLEIRGQRIRLFGVDAPEAQQTCARENAVYRCGQKAALALSDKIGGQSLTCQSRGRDRYRRIIAICYLNGEDLNGWLVRQGWALVYPRYSKGMYSQEQSDAKEGKRGLWAGQFVLPWDWRKLRK